MSNWASNCGITNLAAATLKKGKRRNWYRAAASVEGASRFGSSLATGMAPPFTAGNNRQMLPGIRQPVEALHHLFIRIANHLGMMDHDQCLLRFGKQPDEIGEFLFVGVGGGDHNCDLKESSDGIVHVDRKFPSLHFPAHRSKHHQRGAVELVVLGAGLVGVMHAEKLACAITMSRNT